MPLALHPTMPFAPPTLPTNLHAVRSLGGVGGRVVGHTPKAEVVQVATQPAIKGTLHGAALASAGQFGPAFWGGGEVRGEKGVSRKAGGRAEDCKEG